MNTIAQAVETTNVLQLVPGTGGSDPKAVFEINLHATLLPETMALLAGAPEMLRSAQAIVISDGAGLETAADQLQRIKGIAKSIEDQRKDVTAPIDAAKKKVMDYVRGPLEQLASAETLIKNAIIKFNNEQETLRLQQEARTAEQNRIEQEKLEARAGKLESKGKTEQADALREQAAMQVAAPSPVTSSPKLAGISSRKEYSAEVTDLMSLCKSVAAPALLAACEYDAIKLLAIVKELAASNTPIQSIAADSKFLNTQAKAFKEAFNFPGCRLVTQDSLASRAK